MEISIHSLLEGATRATGSETGLYGFTASLLTAEATAASQLNPIRCPSSLCDNTG